MTGDRRAAVGRRGEALVADHLVAQGFQIVAANVRVGRLEIDLIARRGPLLVFCEVRTRSSRAFLDPAETIDPKKQARLRRAAAGWLASHAPPYDELRFDAASVVLAADAPPSLTYYESAF